MYLYRKLSTWLELGRSNFCCTSPASSVLTVQPVGQQNRPGKMRPGPTGTRARPGCVRLSQDRRSARREDRARSSTSAPGCRAISPKVDQTSVLKLRKSELFCFGWIRYERERVARKPASLSPIRIWPGSANGKQQIKVGFRAMTPENVFVTSKILLYLYHYHFPFSTSVASNLQAQGKNRRTDRAKYRNARAKRLVKFNRSSTHPNLPHRYCAVLTRGKSWCSILMIILAASLVS